MKQYLLSAILSLMVICAIAPVQLSAQENKTEDESIPYALVEQVPTFQGSSASVFSKWVSTQLKYPASAKKIQASGRITLQFTIDKTGQLTNVKILRSNLKSLANNTTSAELKQTYQALEEEAIRVIKSSPAWEPGKQQGEAVNVTFIFPIVFQLK
ncbi:MAG: energy transducer TonB [Bacteroidales bacterium]|nr:energy transducer TonB [Bacteroidales bacterium]MDD3200490.1 energy transducer TonB [Bacteroidales bacterium]